MSNPATLCEKPKGYLVWGIDDTTNTINGTLFDYRKASKGNEALEIWIARTINSKTIFKYYEVEMEKGIRGGV